MGISIEGNLAPELSDVSFQNITDGKDIFLANGDVVIPVDFEWRLTAPTNVFASATTEVADYDTTKYGVTGKIDLIVEGQLHTDRGVANEWVTFGPETPGSSADQWGGVHLAWATAGDTLRFADFGYAENPLFVHWPGVVGGPKTRISNCLIHDFADVGLWIQTPYGNGAQVDLNSVSRGTTVSPSLGLIGVFLDGAGELAFEGNAVQVDADTGVPTVTNPRAVEIYVGKNGCLSPPTIHQTTTISGNTLAGFGEDAALPPGTNGASGVFANWVCGGGTRTVEITENRITDFNFAGLEFSQSSDVQVECNRVEDNFRAVEFRRDGEPTGAGVRFRTNYFRVVPSGLRAFKGLVRTDKAKNTKLGGTGTEGDNWLRTNTPLSGKPPRFILEDEPGLHDILNATHLDWFKDGNLLVNSASISHPDLIWTTLLPDAAPPDPDYPRVDVADFHLSPSDSTCWPQAVVSTRTPSPGPRNQVASDRHAGAAVSSGLPPSVTRIGLPGPNPSQGSTRIQWEVSADHAGWYRMEVFDVAGRKVAVLVNEEVGPGRYAVDWGARSDYGERVSPGVYFLRVTGPGIRRTLKLAVLR